MVVPLLRPFGMRFIKTMLFICFMGYSTYAGAQFSLTGCTINNPSQTINAGRAPIQMGKKI